ncbi:hypothetical protein JJB07_04225 [Tumebacillus sp. ITR2]|uniref:Type II secretion system protein GspF domain-containing protein n=1 Tax=Tumebacillus amylolyticus TaxID=2801339 RepID=A0ABS1J720_9BACL|nr:hypothetical protein [Tumebacillus amylolyticus]
MLYTVIGVSLGLFFLLLIAFQIIRRRQGSNSSFQVQKGYSDLIEPNQKTTRQRLVNFFQKSYVLFSRTPLLESYTAKIRKRLSTIHSYDEFTMRKETMKIAYLTLGILFVAVVLLVLVNRDPTFLAMVVVAVVVINGMLIDTFVGRVEDRLLKQLSHLMTDVRHYYHQHGMVEEAIYEAGQVSKYEAQLHAERIYEVLTANDPQDELENYYEVAPTRFLKGFAGISFLVKEYGDKTINNGSMYLNGLSRLTQEINLEILRRDRLRYLFSGLTIISLAPIFFTKPIEIWARGHFPSMDDFYTGKIGFFTKMIIFAVILISYVLLRKMQENDEGKYAAKATRTKWEKKVYELPAVAWIVDRMVPGQHTKQHFKLTRLLKDTSSPLTIEWLYLQRILLCLATFVVLISTTLYMHHVSKQNVLYAPTKNTTLFGQLSPEEEKKAEELTISDRKIIESVQDEPDPKKREGAVRAAVKVKAGRDASKEAVNKDAARVLKKLDTMENEYFKWWELVIAVGVATGGYFLPLWMIEFRRRMREMDMQNEVDQFHTIIAMLSEIERISVENILEWMERFAVIFRQPLQVCLMDYEAGGEKAMEQLKEDAPFVPFVRTVERLLVAVEKIPIRQAFDDLETERVYYQEQRKEQYERIINEKASWGKMIGFVPMYALVFLYLVIPLILMSMNQMSTYFNQIQTIQ